jgi:membrane protein required for colicin V production
MMTWVDYGIIAIVGISLIIGVFRGFVRELVSLVLWVGAIVATLHYLGTIEQYVSHSIHSIYGQYAAIIIVLLLVVLAVSWFIGKILTAAASSVGLGPVNRFFGLLFGFCRGLLLVAFLITMLPSSDRQSQVSFTDSRLLPYVQPVSNGLNSLIPDDWQDKLKRKLRISS